MKDIRVLSSMILLVFMLALSGCPENIQQGSSQQSSSDSGESGRGD
jgi:hypothetical protein